MVLFDIDHFKKVNDTYGHDAGDVAIKTVTSAIVSRIRDIDFAGRWGGEEIVVGLVGASERDAVMVAESIRETVQSLPMKNKKDIFHVSISGGAASLDHAKDIVAMVDRADEALYAAKNGGRNCIKSFSGLKSRG